MSEKLTSTIRNIAKGIADERYRNKAEIMQGVVQRILQDLGWPIFEPQVFAREFRIGRGARYKVDYALCHPPGKAAVLIEVKDLGNADGKRQRQLLKDRFLQNAPIAVFTDGRIWRFFFLAGAGNLEESLFARIDLRDEDPFVVADTFARYLDREAVKSGAAGKRAQEDYEKVESQRRAEEDFASVWRKLLSKPEESLLLELFIEEVETRTGRKPDSESAAAFIRKRAMNGGTASPAPPSHFPAMSTSRRLAYFIFEGRKETFNSSVECFAAVFRMFAERDPNFCRRYSEIYYGRTRAYLARTKEELYPDTPHLHSNAKPLPGGWWIGTNIGNASKRARIKEVCALIGLEYGRDLKVHIPVGSRKKRRASSRGGR